MSNNAINSDSKNRRSFVALLFAAGYGERWASTRGDGYAKRKNGRNGGVA